MSIVLKALIVCDLGECIGVLDNRARKEAALCWHGIVSTLIRIPGLVTQM